MAGPSGSPVLVGAPEPLTRMSEGLAEPLPVRGEAPAKVARFHLGRKPFMGESECVAVLCSCGSHSSSAGNGGEPTSWTEVSLRAWPMPAPFLDARAVINQTQTLIHGERRAASWKRDRTPRALQPLPP